MVASALLIGCTLALVAVCAVALYQAIYRWERFPVWAEVAAGTAVPLGAVAFWLIGWGFAAVVCGVATIGWIVVEVWEVNSRARARAREGLAK